MSSISLQSNKSLSHINTSCQKLPCNLGFFGSLGCRLGHTLTGKRKPKQILHSFSFSALPFHFPILFWVSSLSAFLPIFPLLSLVLVFCDFVFPSDPMKTNRKGIVMNTDSCAMYDDPKIRTKHQNLLQDYQELQNETEAMKERLQFAKQKRLKLLAEVRFLRHRYEFLKNHSLNAQQKHGLKHQQQQQQQQLLHNFEMRTIKVNKEKSGRKRKASSKTFAKSYNANQREAAYDGLEATFPNPELGFHVNQRTRYCSESKVPEKNSSPISYLKEEKHRDKECVSNRNTTPIFDLNQISQEEEELQASMEPMKMEEPKKNLLRSRDNSKKSELKKKISGCRNVGNGSNRAAGGKRKISWQDQLALKA